MNGFGKIRLMAMLLVVATCRAVDGDVQTSTPCSLSFYRYLFNLPGEKIRPNVPEGTYVFGKRVGPPTNGNQEGQASNVQPAVLKPASSYEAPLYLPPPLPSSTTTTTTTTVRPSTSAPAYIPPPQPAVPYYPAEASNEVQSVLLPAKPACRHPEHDGQRQRLAEAVNGALLPPYRFESPNYQPQATFVEPRVVPSVQVVTDNEIYAAPPTKPTAAFTFRYPVPTPPPQYLRPYVPPSAVAHDDCERRVRPVPLPTTVTTTTTTTPPPPPPPPTPEDAVVETRQNEIAIAPKTAGSIGCGAHGSHVVPAASTDYGVVAASYPSAGYSYDKPASPLVYPAPSSIVPSAGYAYPKPSPSFEYQPVGVQPYAATRGTSLFESEPAKPSSDDGDLVVLKV